MKSNAHFPDTLVSGYEALIPMMTNDPKDRHGLAAAVRGDAAVIVTANLGDFPDSALEPIFGNCTKVRQKR